MTPPTTAYKFRQHCQKPMESVQDYANCLKRAAVDSNFETHRDQALKDQLITGLNVDSILRKLLTTDENYMDTFETLAIALRQELTSAHYKELSAATMSSAATSSVHKVQSSTRKSSTSNSKGRSNLKSHSRQC